MRPALLGTALVALTLCLGSVQPITAASEKPAGDAGRLVVLSTSDVKGKTSPCGCSIPKGGLARRASFADSIRAGYGQVLLVDTGGFFPEPNDTLQRDVAGFLMEAMQLLKMDAVGAGEKELRFGYPFLKAGIERTGLPVVCANLALKSTGKPALTPYLIKKVGSAKVGVFGLMSDKLALGVSQDMLKVEDPTAAARRVIAEMKGKGATVIVLLSQLGKVDSEDLAAAVPGIDVLVVGHSNSLLLKGRRIKETIACYGGEQGQYMGRTLLTLDGAGRMTNAECDVYMMGPEIPHEPEMLKLVKAFEDDFAVKQKQVDRQRAASHEGHTH